MKARMLFVFALLAIGSQACGPLYTEEDRQARRAYEAEHAAENEARRERAAAFFGAMAAGMSAFGNHPLGAQQVAPLPVSCTQTVIGASVYTHCN